MTDRPSRRAVLTGLAAIAAARSAFADAPVASVRPLSRGSAPPYPPSGPASELLDRANLGGSIGYQVVNSATGAVVEELNPNLRLPPASVAKAATAFYALSRLGPSHRFETRLLATGPVVNGRIEGDLVLQGGGDPLLDTDALGEMIAALKSKGIHEVQGWFRVDPAALPYVPHIDPDQPEQVGYNPAIDGLNLNFNRVHFEWKRAGQSYNVTMQARARRFSPETAVAKMAVEDRSGPVYTHEVSGGIDRWTVARKYLGKEGARWLPVTRPVDYVADVFTTLARSYGIVLDRGSDQHNADGDVLHVHTSPQLDEMLRGMLRYSTNLTAEAVGLSATQTMGVTPQSLIRSAREMNLWYNNGLGCRSTGFVDHSGLGYGSRVSPEPAMTFHLGHPLSAELWDRTDDEVLARVGDELRRLLGPASALEIQVKRWRYAGPVEPAPEASLLVAERPGPLLVAGDGFAGAKFEGAFLSGLDAAARLLAGLDDPPT